MAPKSKGRLRGKPFEKGDARAGRPKGTPNKATVEAKEICSAIVDDPKYRENLQRRLLSGRLAPAMEVMLWHYAKGKPKEIHEHVDATRARVVLYEIPRNGRERSQDGSIGARGGRAIVGVE